MWNPVFENTMKVDRGHFRAAYNPIGSLFCLQGHVSGRVPLPLSAGFLSREGSVDNDGNKRPD
jgi:hypothetical protein